MSESIATKSLAQPHFLREYQVPSFLIDTVHLTFDLTDEKTIVTSKLQVRHNRLSQNHSRDLILNGDELKLVQVKLNGKTIDSERYTVNDQFLIIHQADNDFELEIITEIDPHKNTALSGLYWTTGTYCTQCEAEGFRRITYFLDQPDVLSRFTTTIIADQTRYPFLLSNGNQITAEQLPHGRHSATWEDPFKKPCYLFALVAGNFDMLEDQFITHSGREVSLRIYVEKGYLNQAHHALYSLKEAMKWDEQNYGREYDLDIYMIVAIGAFNMGAMENKGLNIFNTKYVLAKPETATDDDYIHILSVIGHEYFHNWTGNRITCRDWFQLSLKEGLTIFRDQSFTEDLLSASVMRIRDVDYLREVQFPEDAGPLAHPVRPESYIEINNFYTATVYNKGAEVLRMLQTLLGKALFRKGMDLYFARHDGQAVTIEDYIKTMEDVSGINLHQFRLWYSQSGTPVVQVEDDYDANQKTYTLTMHQSCLPTPSQAKKEPFFIPIKVGLLSEEGEALSFTINNEENIAEKVLELTNSTQSFTFHNIHSRPIPSLLRHFSAPIKLQYAYSTTDLQTLIKHDPDPFNRWEATQQYALHVMLALIQNLQHEKALELPDHFIKTYEHLLQEPSLDLFLLAELFNLPSEKYIAQQMKVIDVSAIHTVREFVLLELARKLQKLFLSKYQQYHEGSSQYQFDTNKISQRQFKNRCLSYLLLLPECSELGIEQFKKSLLHDMTDTQVALAGLNNLDLPVREKVLNQFYTAFKHDALVVDKWLAIQAATKLPTALSQVKKLMFHESFDIKNPNKVYALIGTFGRNQIHFHAENGEGYAFLRETVQQLDKLNPQVAARMIKPLTDWERYDKERQALMREQLAILLQSAKISNDLYELTTKSLTSKDSIQ